MFWSHLTSLMLSNVVGSLILNVSKLLIGNKNCFCWQENEFCQDIDFPKFKFETKDP